MKNRFFKLIFSLTLLSVLFMTLGCGGSSQKVATQESPEAAVMRISDSWRNSNSSPEIVVDYNKNFIRQATDNSQSSSGQSSSYVGKKITLYDLASDSYELTILDVKKVDTQASVECQFNYTKNNFLIILFQLVFDEGKWWLDDVTITDDPLKKDEFRYYFYHIKLDANGKEIQNETKVESFKGKKGQTVTPKSQVYTDYEYLKDKTKKVTKDDGTLEFYLYYQYNKKTQYTIKYVLYGSKPEKVLKTDKTKSAVIGKIIENITDIIESTDLSGYEFLENESKLTKPVTIEANGKTTFILYYKEKTNEFVITGKVTDSSSSSIPLKGARVQAFYENDLNNPVGEAVTTDESGNYSISVPQAGIYLLVISGEGYEAQTISVEVKETDKNTRANCML